MYGTEFMSEINGMECMGWNIWTTMYVWNGMYGTEYYNICMAWMEWNIWNEMYVMEMYVCNEWEWNNWTDIYGTEFVYEINGM